MNPTWMTRARRKSLLLLVVLRLLVHGLVHGLGLGLGGRGQRRRGRLGRRPLL